MKNLIKISLFLMLSLIVSISEVRSQVIQTIQIPQFSDFDPEAFFNTPEGKLVETIYSSEGKMKEYFTGKYEDTSKKLREMKGFNLKVSKDKSGEGLSPLEFFQILAYLAKEKITCDNEKNPFFTLNNDLQCYLLVPIQPALSYGFPPVNKNKPGTNWVEWISDSLFFSK